MVGGEVFIFSNGYFEHFIFIWRIKKGWKCEVDKVICWNNCQEKRTRLVCSWKTRKERNSHCSVSEKQLMSTKRDIRSDEIMNWWTRHKAVNREDWKKWTVGVVDVLEEHRSKVSCGRNWCFQFVFIADEMLRFYLRLYLFHRRS